MANAQHNRHATAWLILAALGGGLLGSFVGSEVALTRGLEKCHEVVARALEVRKPPTPPPGRIVARNELVLLASAIRNYRTVRGTLPLRLSDLVELDAPPDGALLPDPWGTDYDCMIVSKDPPRATLRSAGPDREFDTDDDVVITADV
jgi:hypothetical protein